MTQSQISIPLTREQAHTLVDAVMDTEDMALSASAFEADDGDWYFQATCAAEPDLQAFTRIAHEALGGAVTFTVEKLDTSTDWVSKSLEGLKPVISGGFYVYGSHDAGDVPEGLTPLHIDAAQAFGTGHHETTTGCLEAVDKVLAAGKRNNIIDVGTGTGILAIALAKRTGKPIMATDNDPIAVRVTDENARLNGVANQVISVVAEGMNASEIKQTAPFDLIVANILAGPLIELAPAIGSCADEGCAIVLSGILATQAEQIIAAYGDADMVLLDRIDKNDWVALTLTKQ